jgi:ectoine hydroxylase-related dioxygenase (phytanoyl-CoA dioxygenase family)
LLAEIDLDVGVELVRGGSELVGFGAGGLGLESLLLGGEPFPLGASGALVRFGRLAVRLGPAEIGEISGFGGAVAGFLETRLRPASCDHHSGERDDQNGDDDGDDECCIHDGGLTQGRPHRTGGTVRPVGALVRLSPEEATVDAMTVLLDREGCAVVERFLDDTKVAALKDELAPYRDATPLGRNDFEGHATKRIYAVFAKVRGFDELATHPLLLGVLDHVLGHYQLSGPVGIDIGPGETPQGLHRDDVVYPIPWPHQQVVLNTIWALDDFTEDNGATLIVPGSHRTSPADQPPEADAVVATMPAGSVMFYVGTVWHGGGGNATDQRRLGVILEYCAAWVRAQENHITAIGEDVIRTLDPKLQELLGYNIFPPFLGYVDGRHPRRTLMREHDPLAQAQEPSR